MKKTFLFLIIIFLIIIASLLIINLNFYNQKYYKIKINSQTFFLETAMTLSEQKLGLMNREFLPKNQGMIFVYEDEKSRLFWMKNTLIPLDLIFIDASNKIVDIKKNFQPCKTDVCETYTSKPAQYVIEVNAGLIDELGIEVGEKIEL